MKYLVAMMIAAFGFSSAFTAEVKKDTPKAEVKKDEKKPAEKN